MQLGNFLLAHDAHAAGGLQGEAGIVAEGGNLDAGLAAGVNEQRARGSGQLLSVDCEGYVGHFSLDPSGLGLKSLSCQIQTMVNCGTPSFANGQGLPFR